MKKYKIPKENADLRFYAVARNFKRIFFYVLILVVMNLAMLSYLDKRVAGLPPIKWWGYFVFEMIVVVVGWIVCNMSLFVTDRYAVGRIKSMRTVRSYGRFLSRNAKIDVGPYSYLKVALACKRGRRTVRIQLFEDGYDGYYREGGTLVKFRGLNYPLCLESEADGVHICSVCGVRTYDKEENTTKEQLICETCRHTIIDVKNFGEKA
ncbi:MAG: hypothetical protein E7592_03405 [Ruminococcaceae bacterium]|nr:hypothetical protein [Oscillospiraceae bacterium]